MAYLTLTHRHSSLRYYSTSSRRPYYPSFFFFKNPPPPEPSPLPLPAALPIYPRRSRLRVEPREPLSPPRKRRLHRKKLLHHLAGVLRKPMRLVQVREQVECLQLRIVAR